MRTGIATALVFFATTGPVVATPFVTVSSSSAAGALDMDGEGTSSTHVVKIADVAMGTDGSEGFTIFVSSGLLTKSDGRTPVSFQVLLVDNGAASPLSSAFTTPAASTYSWSSTGAGAVDKDLYIKYTPGPLHDPGTYTANVDLAVIDN